MVDDADLRGLDPYDLMEAEAWMLAEGTRASADEYLVLLEEFVDQEAQ